MKGDAIGVRLFKPMNTISEGEAIFEKIISRLGYLLFLIFHQI